MLQYVKCHINTITHGVFIFGGNKKNPELTAHRGWVFDYRMEFVAL